MTPIPIRRLVAILLATGTLCAGGVFAADRDDIVLADFEGFNTEPDAMILAFERVVESLARAVEGQSDRVTAVVRLMTGLTDLRTSEMPV